MGHRTGATTDLIGIAHTLGDIGLGQYQRIFEFITPGDQGGNRRGQGAAAAMGVDTVDIRPGKPEVLVTIHKEIEPSTIAR